MKLPPFLKCDNKIGKFRSLAGFFTAALVLNVLTCTAGFSAKEQISPSPIGGLTWVTPQAGESLQELQAAIESAGGSVVTLAPEGRLLVRHPVDQRTSIMSVPGVDTARPAVAVIEPQEPAVPFVGMRLPTPEEEARMARYFIPVQRIEPNQLSRDRALLQGRDSLPDQVDNSISQFFPPIRTQGANSCVAWAVAYYWNTYTQARDEGLDVSGGDNDHICSPAFIYNLFNIAGVGGMYIADVFARLNEVGVSSWTLMPFSRSDWMSWPTEAAWVNALQRRTQDSYSIGNPKSGCTDEEFQAIKQLLANGNILATITDIYENWLLYPNDTSGINNGVQFAYDGYIEGIHAMTIVGYDDNKSYYDGETTRSGAFLIANSYGPDWGVHNTAETSKGFMWVAYDYFKAGNGCFGVAYYNSDRPGYRPRLYAVAGLNHSQRGYVTYRGGTGLPDSPDWLSHAVIQSDGGIAQGMDDTRRVAVDLTDGIHSIPLTDAHLFVQMEIDAQARGSGSISSAVFYHDFDQTGNYEPVYSTDPMATVMPGTQGYATVTFDASDNDLAVSPFTRFLASGDVGGPFAPALNVYTLTNTGSVALDWAASWAVDWLTVAPSNGSLAAGGSLEVTASLTAASGEMGLGQYEAAVTFTNLTAGLACEREVRLSIQSYILTTNIGPFAGGNIITINGSQIGIITHVRVGDKSILPGASGTNGYTITLPAATETGTVDVIVQTAENGDFTLPNAYTYNPPGVIEAPIEPSSGSWTGGYEVVISGQNLCNGSQADVTSVSLAEIPAAVLYVYGSTQIVVMAASAQGDVTGDVVVVSTDYGTTTRSNGFVYVSYPGFAITTETEGEGSITPDFAIVQPGEAVQFDLAAAEGHYIGDGYQNDSPILRLAGLYTNSLLWTNITADGHLRVVFLSTSEDTATNNTPIPWLRHFYPEDETLERLEARASERAASGFYVWQAHIADLDPTDEKSVFKMNTVARTDEGAVLDWSPTSDGRLYSVLWTETLPPEIISPLAENIRHPSHTWTDGVQRAHGFYWVEVRLDEEE